MCIRKHHHSWSLQVLKQVGDARSQKESWYGREIVAGDVHCGRPSLLAKSYLLAAITDNHLLCTMTENHLLCTNTTFVASPFSTCRVNKQSAKQTTHSRTAPNSMFCLCSSHTMAYAVISWPFTLSAGRFSVHVVFLVELGSREFPRGANPLGSSKQSC